MDFVSSGAALGRRLGGLRLRCALAVQETSAACGIQCMPTFQFFKNGKKVTEMQGADPAKLQQLVDANK